MNLVIVESPNKVKTISQFLPKDYIVKASVGHIRKINDSGLYNCGIDVKNNFEADFVVDKDKKDIVKELKDLVKRAEVVYLSTDPDREGESISWHLKEVLNIPAKKLKRCTFHEVTKKAVLEALNNPRKIDEDLVDAANTRAKLDKLVGYRLSPISRKTIGARSVGRCQSAALRIIVDREEEIINFDSKKYFEIYLPFTNLNNEYKAQYKGLLKNKKNSPTVDDENEANVILNDCKNKVFKIKSIESKDRKISPQQPFITSSLQQEASNKLGYSVKRTTQIAQSLFEGINVGGQHVALITYIRTDDPLLSPEFLDVLKEEVTQKFGKDYFVGLREKKKSKNAQEAHEAIRPVDLSMTPEKLGQYIADQQMLKLYTLIYNRTLASVMPDAVITDTVFTITEGKYKFEYIEHAQKFAGFRDVYALDDEELVSGLIIKENDVVNAKDLELVEKATKPKSRYTEASLIKELEKLGIGRPSTYSSIISTILDKSRGYCEESGKSLAPTELGIKLIHYLKEAFPDIVDTSYSSNMETSLDLIAKGKLKDLDFLTEFYSDLEKSIKNTKHLGEEFQKPAKEYAEDHTCPECGNKLIYRTGRYGRFLGCASYPTCKYTEKL